jgi:hypothetical protein
MERVCYNCDRGLLNEPAHDGWYGFLCFPCRFNIDEHGGERCTKGIIRGPSWVLYKYPDRTSRDIAGDFLPFRDLPVINSSNYSDGFNPKYRNFKNYPPDWEGRRNACLERDGHQCRLCSSDKHLHVHHVQPISAGGSHSLQNLVTLCRRCHGKQVYWGHGERMSQAINKKPKKGKNRQYRRHHKTWK